MNATQEKLAKLHHAWLAYYANFGNGAALAAQIKMKEFASVLGGQMKYAEQLIEEELEYVAELSR